MSPFRPNLLLLLGLFVILVSHDVVSSALLISAVDGTEQESVVTQRQRLRHHKKAVGDSEVLPRSSSISSRKQLIPINVLQSSSKSQHEQSTPILTSSSTVDTRQVQDAELQCGDNQSLFRVQVTTDRDPWQTSWEFVDVSSKTVEMAYDNFDRKESIYSYR